MDEQREIRSIKSAIVLALMLLFGTGLLFWKAGFFDERSKKPICNEEHIQLCNTAENCASQGFYWWDNSCHLVEKPQPKLSEYPDYESLNDLSQLTIIENVASWSPEAKLTNIISYQKQLKSVGQFARIYLYAEVSVNDKPLTQYESLYIKLNNIGGHLFRPQSLKIPPDTITKLLYAINNVPYLTHVPYSENKIPFNADWFKLFGNGSSVNFYIYISSLNPATINKIIFYYKCAEGSDCRIEKK